MALIVSGVLFESLAPVVVGCSVRTSLSVPSLFYRTVRPRILRLTVADGMGRRRMHLRPAGLARTGICDREAVAWAGCYEQLARARGGAIPAAHAGFHLQKPRSSH